MLFFFYFIKIITRIKNLSAIAELLIITFTLMIITLKRL